MEPNNEFIGMIHEDELFESDQDVLIEEEEAAEEEEEENQLEKNDASHLSQAVSSYIPEWIGGGVFQPIAPIWLRGGRTMVAACGRHLRVISMLTNRNARNKATTHRLKYTSRVAAHDHPVTAVCALGRFHVASASSDGTLRIWDGSDPKELVSTRIIDVGFTVVALACVADAGNASDGTETRQGQVQESQGKEASINKYRLYLLTQQGVVYRIKIDLFIQTHSVIQRVTPGADMSQVLPQPPPQTHTQVQQQQQDQQTKDSDKLAKEGAENTSPKILEEYRHGSKTKRQSLVVPQLCCFTVKASSSSESTTNNNSWYDVVWYANNQTLHSVYISSEEPTTDTQTSAKGTSLTCTIYSVRHDQQISALSLRKSDGSICFGDHRGAIFYLPNISLQAFSLLQIKSKLHGVGVNRLDDQLRSVAHARMHWHASKVRTLVFDDDNASNSDSADAGVLGSTGSTDVLKPCLLLSGGEESVLVEWDLYHHGSDLKKTAKKRFLPRIGGKIYSLAPDPSGLVLAMICEDNTLRLVDLQTHSVCATISGLRAASSSAGENAKMSSVCSACISDSNIEMLKTEENNGTVFVRSLIGHGSVQAYDLFSDSPIADLQVCATNVVSSFVQSRNGEVLLISPFVVRFAVGPGSIVSIDRRCVQQESGVPKPKMLPHKKAASVKHIECLKFWQRTASAQAGNAYELIFKVDKPHGSHRVSSLAVDRSGNLVVTSSQEDKSFKIWIRKAIYEERIVKPSGTSKNQSDAALETPNVERWEWKCAFVGGYRSLPCGAVSFFGDSSLLAVAMENMVCLWRIQPIGLSREVSQEESLMAQLTSIKCELVTVLLHSSPSKPVLSLGFANGLTNSGRLISVCKDSIHVWNILTGSALWSSAASIHDAGMVRQSLVLDSKSSRFAVTVNMPKVSELSKDRQAVLVYDTESSVPLHVHALPSGSRVLSMAFVPFGKSFRSSSALVILDSDYEISRLRGAYAKPPVGTRPAAGVQAVEDRGSNEANESGWLAALFAFSQQSNPTTPTRSDPALLSLAPTLNSLDRLFGGSSHTLASAADIMPKYFEILASPISTASFQTSTPAPSTLRFGDDIGLVFSEESNGLSANDTSGNVDIDVILGSWEVSNSHEQQSRVQLESFRRSRPSEGSRKNAEQNSKEAFQKSLDDLVLRILPQSHAK